MEIADAEQSRECTLCGLPGTRNYCANCGQPYKIKRISMQGLLHDIFHLFTHLDRGFGYTLKMLLFAPGHMQRTYIEGDRNRHQKPFSMFLICATVAGLARYWMFQILINYYNAGNISEATFFHEYMVIFSIALLPLYVVVVFLMYYNSGYNLAELGVFVLYSISFFFVIAIFISLLKFIWPEFDTAYVELPILLIYNMITHVNFFWEQPRWIVVIKSVVITGGIFLLIQKMEDLVVKLIS